MAFPKPVPADGIFHKEQGKDFYAQGGKWSKPRGCVSNVYLSATDSQPSWNWLGLADRGENLITVRASINPKSDADIGFIAQDGSNTIDFSSSNVNCSTIISWGANGQRYKDWNSMRAPSGGKGIPMNREASTHHVKHDNWSFIELQLLKFGTGVALHWQFQYQSDSNEELLVLGNGYIEKPITAFRKVGFRATQDMDVLALHVTYY